MSRHFSSIKVSQNDPSFVEVFRRLEGWPRSGFKTQLTTMKLRRVRPHKHDKDQDELQIDIEISSTTEKSTRTTHGSLLLTKDQLLELAAWLH